jgi:cytochrome c
MRFVLAITLAVTGAVAAAPSALAATGQEVFNDKCGECHSTDGASTMTAPSLKGVVGRNIASLKDYQYSPALTAKQGAWTEQKLDTFLFNPRGFAPGTDMLVGAADPGERKAIIDYLKTLK